LLALLPSDDGKRLDAAKTKRLVKSLAGWIEVEDDADFWASRYTLNAKPAARPMKLIGPARAGMVAFNAMLPCVLLRARLGDIPPEEAQRLEALGLALYKHWPALPPSSITRYMEHRLFGAESSLARAVLTGEARHQALYQVYHDCCDSASPHGNACRTFGS